MITILQQPQALTLAGNIPEIIIQSDGLNMTVNLSQGATLLLSESYTTDSIGHARVNLRDFVDEHLSMALPSGNLFEQTGSVKQFNVEIIVGTDSTDFSFVAIKGGVDKPLLDCAAYLQEAWLTWQPQTKTVKDVDPEWLSYFAVYAADVKVKAYFAGGMDETIILHSLEAAKHYTMNMTFSDIREEFVLQPIYFDVWVENKPGAGVEFESYHQRYMLTAEIFEYDDIFVFENSVGGLDTLRLTGEKRAVNPVDVDSALFYDESTIDYLVTPQKSYEKNTGFFRSRDAAFWAQDFFQSINKHIYLEEELIRIILLNPEVTTMERQLLAFDFRFSYTKQTRYLALFKKKSPLIDPVIIGPGDEEYYLPPRISDFPQVSDPSALLFPVQIPGTPGWFFISYTNLVAFIYSNLPLILHNNTVGKQGGNEELNEFFHLTQEEWEAATGRNLGKRKVEANYIIESDIAGTLILGRWYNDLNELKEVNDQPIVFAGKPDAGELRWDMMVGNADGSAELIPGDAGESAIRPDVPEGSVVLFELIWNEEGEAGSAPEPGESVWSTERFSTAVNSNTSGKYAKIMEMDLGFAQDYSFILDYGAKASMAANKVGQLHVAFVCTEGRIIHSPTVKITTVGFSEEGDFVLVQLPDNKAALFHKSTNYFMSLQWRVTFQNTAMSLSNFLNGGVYGALPEGANWPSGVYSGGFAAADRVTQTGTATFLNPTSFNPDLWMWVLDLLEYSGGNQTFDVPGTPINSPRVDLLVGGNTNNYTYVTGIESEDLNIDPTIPDGTVMLARIIRNVDGSNTVEPVEPDLNDFVSKSFPGNQTIQSDLTVDTLKGVIRLLKNDSNGKIVKSGLTEEGSRVWKTDTNINTFFGEGAGQSSDLGSRGQTAFGRNAGMGNISGVNWVAIGNDAGMSNLSNSWVAIGLNAARLNTSGHSFIAIGFRAAQNNQTGIRFIAIGVDAGRDNTTGSNWTAIGVSAGRGNLTGINWLALGYAAGLSNTTGSNWTAVGVSAATNNVSGFSFTAIGPNSALNNIAGSNWVAIGLDAGRLYFDGTNAASFSNGVYLGGGTRVGVVGAVNEVVIGYQAIGRGSNTTTIGTLETILTYLFGQLQLGTINNGIGDFLTRSATNVITRRTAAEVRTDLDLTAQRYRDALASLTGEDRLDASAIKNIPTGGADTNAVHYNADDAKNPTEKQRARTNIGSTSSIPQLIATAGAIDNLTIVSNSLVFTGASVVLSGIVAGLDGEEVAILNASGSNLTILSQSTLSDVANRFNGAVIVPNLSILRIKYRTTTNRWFLENVGINDGRYIRKDVNDVSTGGLTLNLSNAPLAVNYTGTSYAVQIVQNSAAPQCLLLRKAGASGSNRIFTIQNQGTGTPVDVASMASSGTMTFEGFVIVNNAIQHIRSSQFDRSIRRDEQRLFYLQNENSLSGSINDYNLLAGNFNIRFVAVTEITGIANGEIGRSIIIQNEGAADLVLSHQNTASLDINRINIIGAANLNIPVKGKATLIYCTGNRWELLSKNF